MPKDEGRETEYPHGRCKSCGGVIEMIIRRNTDFCCGTCEESGPALKLPE